MEEKNRIQITSSCEDRQIIISNSNVEITHQGKPVKFTAPSKERSGLAAPTGYIFLLLDCSSSMAGSKLDQAIKGAIGFSRDALQQGYLVGLIKFEFHAKLVLEPNGDLSNIEADLSGLKAYGATNMEEAIFISTNLLKDQTGQKIIVVITDGMPTNHGDPQKTINAGEFAKSQKIDIMAIGTDDADKEFLGILASRAELGIKVPNEKFEQTISSSFKMLSSGSVIAKR
jgi:uncharacterized protein YegL